LVKAQLVKLDEKEPDLDKLLTDMSSLYQIWSTLFMKKMKTNTKMKTMKTNKIKI
jgi:hypothetical protein